MKLESEVLIQAPPKVVFRFFRQLDHLRFVCTERRQEWCPALGCVQEEGDRHEVLLRQGKHEIRLRFRTSRLVPDRLLEDQFISWPLRGAARTLHFESAEAECTRVTETNAWEPPWFARSAVKERSDEQQWLFDQKLENGRRIVEAAYEASGDAAFSEGIFSEAEALGIDPVV